MAVMLQPGANGDTSICVWFSGIEGCETNSVMSELSDLQLRQFFLIWDIAILEYNLL